MFKHTSKFTFFKTIIEIFKHWQKRKKNQHYLKGTAMQIEQALINDRVRVSKVS